MSWNLQGATRTVYIGKKRAYKIPHFTYSWKNFLKGMLANDQEKDFSAWKEVEDLLCPILWTLPFGLLVVMPKCQVLTREEWLEHYEEIQDTFKAVANLVEMKANSFGWYQGKIVAIDYGGPFW